MIPVLLLIFTILFLLYLQKKVCLCVFFRTIPCRAGS